MRRSFESFMCVSVPLPDKNSCTIEECLEKFNETDKVDDFYDSHLKQFTSAKKTIGWGMT